MEQLNSVYYTKGKGKPLFFLHGLGASLHQTVSLLDGIENIQLVSLDFPGHGKTPYPSPGNEPSFDFYTDELVRLMDHLSIEKADIGGISMGAGISLSLASRYPDRVNSLILVRPAWLSESNPSNLKILLKAAEYLPKEFGRSHFEKLDSFQKIRQELPAAAMSILGLFSPTQQKSLDKVLWHLVSDHPEINTNVINSKNIPTCIIANLDDPLHPFEMAKTLNADIVASKLHKVTSRYKNDKAHKKEVQAIIEKFLVK
jgi:pimeloyl-ACP methyl ester carboxylesterase